MKLIMQAARKCYRFIRGLKWLAKKPVVMDYYGGKLYFDPNDSNPGLRAASRACIEDLSRESQTIKAFCDCIKKTATVLDIGACFGAFTIPAAYLAKQVIAVEAHPANYEYLKRNVSINNDSNVEMHNGAVADYNGTIKLYVSPYDASCHALRRRHNNKTIYDMAEGGPSIEIPCFTVDTLLNGRKIDVVKMDIEGAEWRALKGMSKTLHDNLHLTMIMEFSSRLLKEMGDNPEQVLAFLLNKHQFTVAAIDELGAMPDNKIYKDIDADWILGFCSTGKAVNLMLWR